MAPSNRNGSGTRLAEMATERGCPGHKMKVVEDKEDKEEEEEEEEEEEDK
jgi:hypothetical protein